MHENVLSLTLLLSVKVPFIRTPLKRTSSHSGTLQSRKSTPPKNYIHSSYEEANALQNTPKLFLSLSLTKTLALKTHLNEL